MATGTVLADEDGFFLPAVFFPVFLPVFFTPSLAFFRGRVEGLEASMVIGQLNRLALIKFNDCW